MFVIEKLIRDHEARNEAWEAAREKWMNTHDYYSRSDYEDRYPRPGHGLKLAGKVFLVVLALCAVIGLMVFTVITPDHPKKHENKPVQKTVQETGVKVGDKVQVVYGDYKDSVGEVIKVGNDTAIIKLIHSTYTHAMADAQNRTGGQDDGSLLSIGDLDNLVPYKEVK